MEDCELALVFLKLEGETPLQAIFEPDRRLVDIACVTLVGYLHEQDGLNLWRDIASAQHSFVVYFSSYVLNIGQPPTFSPRQLEGMVKAVERLKHILDNRFKGTRYAGQTGIPFALEAE